MNAEIGGLKSDYQYYSRKIHYYKELSTGAISRPSSMRDSSSLDSSVKYTERLDQLEQEKAELLM
jgi:hypothetical protein